MSSVRIGSKSERSSDGNIKQLIKLEDRAERVKSVALNKEIAMFAKQKNLNGALESFHKAQEKGWSNTHTFSAIINAHIRCGDVDGAEAMFDLLKKTKGVRMDVISCTTMLKGYCSIGNMMSAQRLLEEMHAANPRILPNIRTVNTFLRGCLMFGNMDEANLMLAHCQKTFSLSPDVSSWEYVVALLCQGLCFDKVTPIIGRLKSNEEMASGMPNMYLCLARAYALAGDEKSCSKAIRNTKDILDRVEVEAIKKELNEDISEAGNKKSNTGGFQVIGGKRAWKNRNSGKMEEIIDNDTDLARGQSLEVYKEHVKAEITQDVALITSFLSNKSNSFEVMEFALSRLQYVFYFGYDVIEQAATGECVSSMLFMTLLKKFGLLALIKRAHRNNNRDTDKVVLYNTSTGSTRSLPAKSSMSKTVDCGTHKQNKKKKKKVTTLFASSLTNHYEVEIDMSLLPNLEEYRAGYRKFIDMQGKLDFGELFSLHKRRDSVGGDLKSEDARKMGPVNLEICSGAGEWVVQQAKNSSDCNKETHWISLEFRHDRVYKTFSRTVLEHCPNLVMLGGDAGVVLPRYIKEGSLSGVFVNYPEPPQQSGPEGACSQGKHLLTADFMVVVAESLQESGLFTILTDNVWYGKLLLRTLAALPITHPHVPRFVNTIVTSDDNMTVEMQLSGLTLYKGKPGPACGHIVDASSYFDRLWKRDRNPDRFFISIRKDGNACGSRVSAVTLQPNRHKRAAGVILPSSIRGKKTKFEE